MYSTTARSLHRGSTPSRSRVERRGARAGRDRGAGTAGERPASRPPPPRRSLAAAGSNGRILRQSRGPIGSLLLPVMTATLPSSFAIVPPSFHGLTTNGEDGQDDRTMFVSGPECG